LSISSISFTISFLSIFPSSRVFLFMFIQFYLVRDSQSTTLWSNALPWWVLVVVKHEFRHTLHIMRAAFWLPSSSSPARWLGKMSIGSCAVVFHISNTSPQKC
jgi:hypothetical protein